MFTLINFAFAAVNVGWGCYTLSKGHDSWPISFGSATFCFGMGIYAAVRK